MTSQSNLKKNSTRKHWDVFRGAFFYFSTKEKGQYTKKKGQRGCTVTEKERPRLTSKLIFETDHVA